MVALVFGALTVQTVNRVLTRDFFSRSVETLRGMAAFLGIFTVCRQVADFRTIEATFREINKFLYF